MTKCSMRQLLCIALFLLYCTCGCFAASVVQQLPQKGQSALQTYTVSAPEEDNDKSGPEWQPIRIVVYTKFVEDVLTYCKTMKGLEDYEGIEEEFEEFCGDENNKKLIPKKRDILLKEVLPKAIKLHTDRIKVKRGEENLKIRTMREEETQEECVEFVIPERHENDGIPNADFVIYVSLSTTRGVAICSKDDEGRPTSAVIKFVVNDIKATRQYIRFTAHEIAHALGFEGEFMKALGITVPRNGDLQSTRGRGRSDFMVKFEKTVEILKNHYNCQKDEVKGLSLQSANHWTHTHWERRLAKDELMSTYIGEPTGMYYTALTLATFHEMKFYSANFSMAEPMSWGKQFRCEFLQGKQYPTHTEYPNMFCKKEEQNNILQCTSDRFALGMCLTQNDREKLPDGYHYFIDRSLESVNDLMDGNPIIRPLVGTACEDGDESLLPGSFFGRESRCLNAKDLVLRDPKDQKSPNIAGVCAKVKCGNDKTVSVQLKGYEQNDKQWHECSGDKATVELDGSVFSNGTIECPKYEEVCTGLPKTERLTIKFYNGSQGSDVYDTVVKEDEEEEEEQTNTEHTPVSPAPNPDDNVEKEVNVPTVNDKNGTQTDTKPESTVNTLPQVPPNTSEEAKKEKEKRGDDEDNETSVTPSGDATISSSTINEDSVSQSADTATVPSDGSHDNVSDNSNTSVIPPHNMDSSQKEDSSKPGSAPETKDSQHHEKTPQDEAPQEEEIPPKEGESSKSESPDNNNTGSLANEQGDHNTEKDTDYSEVESSKNPTGVSSGKDSDSSIAISFFGPLMLLVCAVAAVGAL